MSDLDRPATVLWVPEQTQPMIGGKKTRFDTLREALKYVMEKLDPQERRNVRIMTDGNDSLAPEEIATRYGAL